MGISNKEFGKAVKRKFGRNDDVDYVNFYADGDFVIIDIRTIEEISHKQVNSVLNQYALGHWQFINTKAIPYEIEYPYNGEVHVIVIHELHSYYRTTKAEAFAAMGL